MMAGMYCKLLPQSGFIVSNVRGLAIPWFWVCTNAPIMIATNIMTFKIAPRLGIHLPTSKVTTFTPTATQVSITPIPICHPSDSSGKNAMMKMAVVLTAANGSARIEMFSIDMFEIPDAMKAFKRVTRGVL